ncbi:hypothetical protein ANO11243_056420 [Dothideomycetidae sp. 11243]|nr:hypothetical protein ANO11243_056420 [fungal sp. No.11243]
MGPSTPNTRRMEGVFVLTKALLVVALSLHLEDAGQHLTAAFDALQRSRISNTDIQQYSSHQQTLGLADLCRTSSARSSPQSISTSSLSMLRSEREDFNLDQSPYGGQQRGLPTNDNDHLSRAHYEDANSVSADGSTLSVAQVCQDEVLSDSATGGFRVIEGIPGDDGSEQGSSHTSDIHDPGLFRDPVLCQYPPPAREPDSRNWHGRSMKKNTRTTNARSKDKESRREDRTHGGRAVSFTSTSRHESQIVRSEMPENTMQDLETARRIMPDATLTIQGLLDWLYAESDHSSHYDSPDENMRDLIDGLHEAFSDFSGYLSRLLRDFREAPQIGDWRATPSSFPSDDTCTVDCLKHLRTLQIQAVYDDLSQLGQLSALHNLYTSYEALNKELNDVDKPIRKWAQTRGLVVNSSAIVPKHQRTRICAGYIVYTGNAFANNHEQESSQFSIKLHVQALKDFAEELQNMWPGVQAFSEQLWQTLASNPSPDAVLATRNTMAGESLFEFLKAVDETQ